MQFVRPAATDRPTWSLYEAAVYRGTVTAEPDGGRPLWRVQVSREAHRGLDDAIRSLRRPRTEVLGLLGVANADSACAR